MRIWNEAAKLKKQTYLVTWANIGCLFLFICSNCIYPQQKKIFYTNKNYNLISIKQHEAIKNEESKCYWIKNKINVITTMM